MFCNKIILKRNVFKNEVKNSSNNGVLKQGWTWNVEGEINLPVRTYPSGLVLVEGFRFFLFLGFVLYLLSYVLLFSFINFSGILFLSIVKFILFHFALIR